MHFKLAYGYLGVRKMPSLCVLVTNFEGIVHPEMKVNLLTFRTSKMSVTFLSVEHIKNILAQTMVLGGS